MNQILFLLKYSSSHIYPFISFIFFLAMIFLNLLSTISVFLFCINQSLFLFSPLLYVLRKYSFCFMSRLSIWGACHFVFPWKNYTNPWFWCFLLACSPALILSSSIYTVYYIFLYVFSLSLFLKLTNVLNNPSSNVNFYLIFPI